MKGTQWFGVEDVPDIIMLEQHDVSVSMPDPDLLRLHFQVAEILDVSGLSWKIDDAVWEGKQVQSNIAPDGSTNIALAIRTKLLIDV